MIEGGPGGFSPSQLFVGIDFVIAAVPLLPNDLAGAIDPGPLIIVLIIGNAGGEAGVKD